MNGCINLCKGKIIFPKPKGKKGNIKDLRVIKQGVLRLQVRSISFSSGFLSFENECIADERRVGRDDFFCRKTLRCFLKTPPQNKKCGGVFGRTLRLLQEASSGIMTTPSFFFPSILTVIGCSKRTCRRCSVSSAAGRALRKDWL